MNAERRMQHEVTANGTAMGGDAGDAQGPPLRSRLRGMDFASGMAALRCPDGLGGAQMGPAPTEREGGQATAQNDKIDQAEAQLPQDRRTGWGRVLADCHGVDVRANNIDNPLALKHAFPGVRVTADPFSPCLRDEWGFAYQCVEFVNRYYALRLGHKNMVGTGNAKDYLGQNDRGLETHYNNGPTRPQAGDLLVSVSGGGGFGHVGIVRSVSAGGIEVAQQNTGTGSAIRNESLAKAGKGWRIGDGSYWRGFRRKPGAAPPVSDDPEATPESVPGEAPEPAGETNYTVRRGDTLSAIARRLGVPGGYPAIARLNGIANPNVIYPGQVLRIPSSAADLSPEAPSPAAPGASSASYTVVAGDTLSAIAARFRVAGGYRELARLNGIANPNLIHVGQVLQIPGAGHESATATTQAPESRSGGKSAPSAIQGPALQIPIRRVPLAHAVLPGAVLTLGVEGSVTLNPRSPVGVEIAPDGTLKAGTVAVDNVWGGYVQYSLSRSGALSYQIVSPLQSVTGISGQRGTVQVLQGISIPGKISDTQLNFWVEMTPTPPQFAPVPLADHAPGKVRWYEDNAFMRKMSALTGLTGLALLGYVILSEGSRLYPPRNLVPIP